MAAGSEQVALATSIATSDEKQEEEKNEKQMQFWQPNTPHEIELSITVQYVGAIDVVQESFDARLWIDIFWLPSEEEYKSDSAPKEWNFEKNIQPQNIVSLNAFDNPKEAKIKQVGDRKMYHTVVQLSGTFSSPFDLHSFPFDCQKIYIVIEMGNMKNMIYKPASHISSILSVEAHLCVLNEWDFEDASIAFTASDAVLSKQGNRYAQCIVQLILPRRWESFVLRYVSIICLLVLSIFATYSIEWDSPGDRLGFIFTLLLTLVAFEFIISDKLPPTSYLTFFEHYFLSCMLIIFANVFTVAMAPTFINNWGYDDFDIVCFYLSIASIAAVHLYYFIMSFVARKKAFDQVNEVALDSMDDDEEPKNIKVSKNNIVRFPNEKDQRFGLYKTD